MTCIAARIYPNRVEMAGDSQVNYGFHDLRQDCADSKIISAGPFLVGFCGDVKAIIPIKDRLKRALPRKKSTVWDPKYWIRTTQQALRGIDKADELEWAILVACVDWVAEIDDHQDAVLFAVPYGSTGSGRSIALGALAAGKDPQSAVEISSQFITSVGGRIHSLYLTRDDI